MNEPIILLVEDNTDDAALTLDAVEHSKVPGRMVVVDNGAAALDYLFGTGPYSGRSPSLDPGLILLDLNLPKIDGLEVLRQLRADPRTKFLPVVILTSSRESRDLRAAYGLGANSYIRKPVDFDEFIEVIRQIGEYWLGLNELPPGPTAP